MNVYQAISAVQAELAVTGISKDRKASGGGANYSFRGIDDVYSHLAPLLAKHGLVIIPRCIDRLCVERQSKNGGALFYVTVRAEFDFVSSKDGSIHTCATFGEAMDTSDKATNKAMSAAYKYAAFMTFCIPVEGDNDTENSNHQVESGKNYQPEQKKPDQLKGPYKTKTALWAAVRAFDRELRGCGDIDQLEAFVSMEESGALLKQCDDEYPALTLTGDGMPPEYEPLRPLIGKMRAQLQMEVGARIDDQGAAIAQIRTLLEATKTPIAQLFAKFNVMSLNELTLDQATDCIDWLKTKITEKA